MSTIDRVSTAQQTAYMLGQINQANAALDKTTQQIASGDTATTYAGFGNQAQVLQATISASARNTAYTAATTLATTQADIQDTQLTSLSSLATQLQTAVSSAVANNDPSTLMTTVQSVFSQATSILNSQDANGDYIYGGGNSTTPPVSVTTLSQLSALGSSASGAFANGSDLKSVQVGDGQTVTYGLTASWQHLWGSEDPVLYGQGTPISGSANGKPNSNAYILEADWVPFGKDGSLASPFVNLKLGVQYTIYTEFNGGTTNYDGFGRNASDNNTLYLFLWTVF